MVNHVVCLLTKRHLSLLSCSSVYVIRPTSLMDGDAQLTRVNITMVSRQDANKRDQMIANIDSDMRAVRDAISQVTCIRNTLQEDAQKLKTEIISHFSDHVKALRCREEQLMRQVDVFANNQMTSLYSQVAKLYHVMGRLETVKGSLMSDRSPKLDERYVILECEMDSVKKLRDQKSPYFSYVFDDNILFDSIQHCGRFVVLEPLLSFPLPEGSKSLPLSVEEYQAEIEDHHVMHKTLEKCVVNVRPPSKLPSDFKLWIASGDAGNEESPSMDLDSAADNAARVNLWLQNKTPSVFDKNSRHLHKWLNQIRDAYELENDQLDGFQVVTAANIDGQSSSESIEEISATSQCESPYDFITATTQMTSADWLSRNCSNNNGNSCYNCTEMEDLGTKAKWLIEGNKGEMETEWPDIQEACKANETCGSFCDCLFDPNCATQWLQREKSTNNSGPIINKNISEPMLRILRARNDEYLSGKQSPVKNKEWKYVNIQENGIKNWLHQEEKKGEKKEEKKTEKEDDEEEWLVGGNSQTNDLGRAIATDVENMFTQYLCEREQQNWLAAPLR